MFPIIQVGPLAIQVPGLLLLLGVWVGVSLAERSAPKHGVDPAQLSNLIFIGLVVGVIGARLGYAARYPDVYAASPLSLVALTPVTLAPTDGVALSAIFCLVFGHRRGLRFWPTLDGLTPALAVIGVAIGLAHLASGDAFGAPTTVPWAVELWGARRHPSQVYEILAALAVLLLVLRMDRDIIFSGASILVFVAASAGSRLFLEAFRGDSIIVAGGLREAQLVALPVMLAALLGLHLRARLATTPAPTGEVEESGQARQE